MGIESSILLILTGEDSSHAVQAAFAHAQSASKRLRILQILGEMGAVDEHLLGHAAADHAGAADPVFLGHRHARAVRRRYPARAHPARTGTDGDEVVIVIGHR